MGGRHSSHSHALPRVAGPQCRGGTDEGVKCLTTWNLRFDCVTRDGKSHERMNFCVVYVCFSALVHRIRHLEAVMQLRLPWRGWQGKVDSGGHHSGQIDVPLPLQWVAC